MDIVKSLGITAGILLLFVIAYAAFWATIVVILAFIIFFVVSAIVTDN